MDVARYIALEGSEGCGKSTHAARLAEELGAVLTRETGGTAIGQRVRDILHDTSLTDLSHRAEALLAAADRAQHFHEVVLPALTAGRYVVSDRSVYSMLAYQGYGRGLDLDQLRSINDWAMQGQWPQLVLLIDAPSEVLAARMHGRQLDRFEQEGDAFHDRVRGGYRAMAAANPEHWVVIDGAGTIDEVSARVRAAVAGRVG